MLNTIVHVITFILGLLLFVGTTTAVVRSMLAPRRSHSWLLGLPNRITRLVYGVLVRRSATYATRDTILSTKAPTTILVQLIAFVLSYQIALMLMIFAVDDYGVARAMLQAGSSLMTLGIVEPAGVAETAISLAAALTGLVVIALLIGYLLTLYAAFTARESRMAKLSLLAGEPAWGPEIISRSYLLGDPELQGLDVEAWIDWASDVRMSQASNPVLSHFRSPGPGRSWVVSLIAVLDASALCLTTVHREIHDEAAHLRLIAEGAETMAILCFTHEYARIGRRAGRRPGAGGLDEVALPAAGAGQRAVISAIAADSRTARGPLNPDAGEPELRMAPGITRADWDHACEVLSRSGVELVPDLDEAWLNFSMLRATYAHNACTLAEATYSVPAPWSGTRNPITPTIWPALASESMSGDK